MAIVAMSPDIRTRTLRPSDEAIKPSRIPTLRTADSFHASFATKNFRSISTGQWCSCSGRSDFSSTTMPVLLMAVFGCRPTRRLKYDSYAKFFKSSSPTRSRGRGLPSSIAVLALSHPITGSEDCCARATGQAAAPPATTLQPSRSPRSSPSDVG